MGIVRMPRDAEAELNLPPGFRFHPTDEELVEHYLCRKAAGLRPPVLIIAEVDLYKFDPWELPEKALFGQREWYFFTPRDRKYPNGTRPNRAAGQGYWKATGADRPVAPRGAGRTLGIRKALVFYSGKPPHGVKTDWIMHEYRLADAGRGGKTTGTLRLDDWVLCRLYNKKNEWEKMQQEKEEKMAVEQEHSSSLHTRTPESEIDNGPFPELDSLLAVQNMGTVKEEVEEEEGEDWFMGLNLDELQGPCAGLDAPAVTSEDLYASMSFAWPSGKPGRDGTAPF